MKSKTPLQGSSCIERMCQLAQVSRAGFYRYLQGREPVEECMTVQSAIQEIALLSRSPVLLPIPGTSSVAPLEENVAAAGLKIDENKMQELAHVVHG